MKIEPGANLRDADLQGADLQGVNLRDANLQGADLQGADLQGADLRYANLRYANLQGANLQGVDLRDADLRDTCIKSIMLRTDGHVHLLRTYVDGTVLITAGCRSFKSFITAHRHWVNHQRGFRCPLSNQSIAWLIMAKGLL